MLLVAGRRLTYLEGGRIRLLSVLLTLLIIATTSPDLVEWSRIYFFHKDLVVVLQRVLKQLRHPELVTKGRVITPAWILETLLLVALPP